ncbi:hypothetical protein [Mycobacterium uberis]|uniref:hypothetical protein n=1 Tax=Mycobacterium uberis TaxID=2162698 RepID=UPI000E30365C|nr:hypothetical protein [Mycobacterium uberis]
MSAGDDDLDSLTLDVGGLVIGAITVALLGMCGVFSVTFTTNDTFAADHTTSLVVPCRGIRHSHHRKG